MAVILVIIGAAIAAAVIVSYFLFTKGAPVKNWLTEYSYAHRGAHGGDVPENSMQAFELAALRGYAIELDVHLSRDGQPVVFHDSNLKRMTGIDKPIASMDWAELSRLRLNGSGEGIPLLDGVLKQVAGRVPLLVELKNTGRAGKLEETTYQLLKNYSGRYAVQSFSPYSVGWFRLNAPEVLRGQLSSRFDNLDEAVPKLPAYQVFVLKNLLSNLLVRPNFISYEVDSLPIRVVSRLRKKGISILGWTVRSKEQIEKAARYCDAVIFEKIEP